MNAHSDWEAPKAFSCWRRCPPQRADVEGTRRNNCLGAFCAKTKLFARFRLGASGGELLVPPRSSARMRLKERRCQKAALSLRILSRPQNQPSLYLRGLRTAVDHSTKLGKSFQVSPPHPAPRRGYPLQAGEGRGLPTGGIRSTNRLCSVRFWVSGFRFYCSFRILYVTHGIIKS